MMIKLVYGCCIIPMLVLLPVYMEADLDHRPRRAVLSCMLGTPLLAVVEAVRTAHTRDSDGILKRMGVAMFLLIVRSPLCLSTTSLFFILYHFLCDGWGGERCLLSHLKLLLSDI